jgi:hypothetical protein
MRLYGPAEAAIRPGTAAMAAAEVAITVSPEAITQLDPFACQFWYVWLS